MQQKVLPKALVLASSSQKVLPNNTGTSILTPRLQWDQYQYRAFLSSQQLPPLPLHLHLRIETLEDVLPRNLSHGDFGARLQSFLQIFLPCVKKKESYI